MGNENSDGIGRVDGITNIGHIDFDVSLKSNVYEIGSHFVIQAEIPNAAYENIKISLAGKRFITLSVNFNSIDDCNGKYHLREIKEKKTLKRTFVIPFDLDIMGIETTCQNGFLEIVIKKTI